jgi:hypothetical protein
MSLLLALVLASVGGFGFYDGRNGVIPRLALFGSEVGVQCGNERLAGREQIRRGGNETPIGLHLCLVCGDITAGTREPREDSARSVVVVTSADDMRAIGRMNFVVIHAPWSRRVLAHPASIKPIRLQVCCDTVLSTADVRVIVHTQSDPRNVAVTLEIDGPAYWTYSELPLNGEKSPATFQVRYPQLPSGAYTITVVLWRHDLKTYEAGRASGRVRLGPLED